MRLPKPIATRVRFQSKTLGSIYTAAQMKAYATKAVEAEREACADICDAEATLYYSAQRCAAKIRARGKKFNDPLEEE